MLTSTDNICNISSHFTRVTSASIHTHFTGGQLRPHTELFCTEANSIRGVKVLVGLGNFHFWSFHSLALSLPEANWAQNFICILFPFMYPKWCKSA